MLPQKMLKIEPLKLPETGFQSNLLSNFFTITIFIGNNHLFIYSIDQSLLCQKVG